MKIGFVYPEYSHRRGIERASAELALRLSILGHEVHFCGTYRDPDAPLGEVQFHKIPTMNFVNSAQILTFAFLGKRKIGRGNYDISHSFGNIIGSDIITAHSCHKAGLRMAREHQSTRIQGAPNRGVADRMRLFIEWRNFRERNYKRVIALSQGVKRELMELYKVSEADICVIPNGVNTEEFNPKHRTLFRRETRKNIGISFDEFVLVFVANEFDRKGLEFVIEALHILKRKDVKLIVLGGDDRVPYLERAKQLGVEKQVLFLGNVEKISKYYVTGDVFILPTFYEAFSLATLEAAASGLPLFVTRVNGTDELVREGENGFFITRDGEHIAESLRSILDDSPQLLQLGVNARLSAEHYSWDSIVARTLAVYYEVCGKNT